SISSSSSSSLPRDPFELGEIPIEIREQCLHDSSLSVDEVIDAWIERLPARRLSVRPDAIEKLPHRVEGYWRQKQKQEQDADAAAAPTNNDDDDPLSWPTPVSDELWNSEDQQAFRAALARIQ